jgi:hypothetical protein
MPAAQLITLSSATVLRGKRAWTRIKSTAAEQRQLWREVGEALCEGRRMYPANQAFGAWCVNEGFDMDARVRSDAMWLAQNWAASSTSWKTGDTHPTHIRASFKAEIQPPSPDLDISEPANADLERIAKVMPIAKKVNKLAAHAAGTGPEAETARKYLRKQAEAKGMTVDEMVGTADKLDPIAKAAPDRRDHLAAVVAAIHVQAESFAHILRAVPVMSSEFLVGEIYSYLKKEGL